MSKEQFLARFKTSNAWVNSHGEPVSGEVDYKIKKINKAGTIAYIYGKPYCSRCGGTGTYRDMGVCFLCCGNPSPSVTKFYAREHFEKVVAPRREKVIAKRQAEYEERMAKFEADRQALKAAFYAANEGFKEAVEIIDAMDKAPAFLVDILEKFNNRCELSEKQVGAFISGVHKAKAEQKEAGEVIEGRYEFSGKVLSTKSVNSIYGAVIKILIEVQADSGTYKLWGTCPASILGERIEGKVVTMTAKVERSEDDASFGFFSRPTKARVGA